MIEALITYITAFISSIGYIGLFFLMFLESTVFPLPSELVMPFAGFLVALGEMNTFAAILASLLGSLAGSLFAYYIGKNYGMRFVKKFGKYFFLDKTHLQSAEKWFKKYGDKTILFSRFIPGIRHVISIPAGVGKMNLKKFCLFTAMGAGIWNSFLLWLGYVLQKNWDVVYRYTEILDMAVIFFIIAFIVYWFYSSLKKNKS